MQKNLNTEKIAFKAVQIKFLAMHITNHKLSFNIFTVGDLQNILHLSDAFIQSDLQCIQAIHLYFQYVCSLGIEPTTFALLTQCSTTEPQA